MIKTLFIINPISGIGKQKNISDKIASYIDKNKFEYSIAFSEYAHHATELAKKAVDEGIELIIAIGGDGSINDVANAIANTNVVLGIIPSGSGNGLARFLKIPLNIMNAIKVINKFNTISIDTIKIKSDNLERVCTSIAGIGFDALVAKKFSKAETRGFNSYMNIIVSDYPAYKIQDYKLTLDDKKEIHTKALLIGFANSNQYGYNAAIAPNASITDGYIDISISKKIPLLILPFVSQMLWTNTVYYSNYVKNYKAKKIKLISNDNIINIDG
ncbi:diacylglycerol kinase family lipid kinase, partial [Odoribacter sp. OttesenSCG-928-L07]|nr:diacylglycerol kinase family lipid kinase [Odoribacter sp. OttesenSCG-928-L07]